MPMSQNVIIIGGGFAGLSAGTALAERGHRVTLLEGRQVLGGRAYSFRDPQTGDAVDNGQHLFMGCYEQTQNFLARIGTLSALRFQSNLSADFQGAQHSAHLRCWPLPSPWHLLSGLFRLSSLSWADRFRLLKMHRALKQAAQNKEALDHITVKEWLTRWGQSETAQRHLWDLIAIATLNEDPAIAAAAPFATVLEQAFFRGRENAQLGLSAVGLSELYTHAARSYIQSRGGQIRTKAPVDRLLIRNGRVEGVQLREGERMIADWVISAVPPPAFLKLLPPALVAAEPAFERIQQLRAAPIISIHLWFDREISRRAFVGLLDTHVQWFFNKSAIFSSPVSEKGYISLVISGAHTFIEWSDTRLQAMVLEELRRLFPKARQAALTRSLVIKEYQATLSPVVGSEALRPEYRTPLAQLLLAGDWTRTGLPATIESACVSGHACAKIVSSSAGVSGGSTDESTWIPRQEPRGMTETEAVNA
jgi:squalene-associated FAD-dependent desaturase